VTGCRKTYVLLLAEKEGFGHVHFHVVPRAADLPEEFRGPRVFGLLGVPVHDQVPEEEQDRPAEELHGDLVARRS
jgi:diadenosine tetraphosphate (Ap4A) HIT family hydrolase